MPILTPEERVGTCLADKYELRRILGQGGMGTVFEAEHRWTGRRVAVKMLRPELSGDERALARFLREARAATTLDHPNVVQVLDMGQDEDDTVYLVMEFLVGESLAEILARRVRLSLRETVAMMLPVLDAVESAHRSKLLHRDIKPDNIFLAETSSGLTPKLLDFGLVKALEGEATLKTATGHVLGTPLYMSPEQAGGSACGPQTDVWALGAVLFECLSGQPPFKGESLTALLLRIVSTNAPSLAGRVNLPKGLTDTIDDALRRDLDARHASAYSLAEGLRTTCEFRSSPGDLPALAVGPSPATTEPAAVAGQANTTNPSRKTPPTNIGAHVFPPTTDSTPARADRPPKDPGPSEDNTESKHRRAGKKRLAVAVLGGVGLLLSLAVIASALILVTAGLGSEELGPVQSRASGESSASDESRLGATDPAASDHPTPGQPPVHAVTGTLDAGHPELDSTGTRTQALESPTTGADTGVPSPPIRRPRPRAPRPRAPRPTSPSPQPAATEHHPTLQRW